MAREYRAFQATIPPGTSASAPITVDLPMPARVVRRIDIDVPPGANGVVGIRVTSGGVPIIPIDATAWIIASGARIQWPIEGAIETGAWQLQGYNIGSYAHTVYVTFALDPVAAATAYRQPVV